MSPVFRHLSPTPPTASVTASPTTMALPDYEAGESDRLNEEGEVPGQAVFVSPSLRQSFGLLTYISRPTRSIYAMTRSEITKGIANRFVHSRTYIFLYLGMAALSATTVGLSLSDGCPGLAFYILEVIINTSMILEVAIRFVAFGRVSRHLTSGPI